MDDLNKELEDKIAELKKTREELLKSLEKAEHKDKKEDQKIIAEALDDHNEKKHDEDEDEDSAMKKMTNCAPSMVKFEKNGQWSMSKADINKPNTSSNYTDPSISPTGGKTRKWQGSDPRKAVGKPTEHSDDMGTVIPEKSKGDKYRARTTGTSMKRDEDASPNTGKKQDKAKKH